MKQYHDLLRHILENGETTTDRTGTGTQCVFGYQMRFNMADGFPLLTTKRVSFRLILEELLWFLRGDTSLRSLLMVNVHIWDEWPFKAYLKANNLPIPEINGDDWTSQMKAFTDRIMSDAVFNAQYGDIGPIYGRQWRSWPSTRGGTIDQIVRAIHTIKTNPDSRRIIVTAWNPDQIDEMARAGLPPCHCLFQFKVINGKLSMQLYQRSADTFLGVPFNIASYSLLLMMSAQATELTAHEFIWTGGDVHLYLDHIEQAKTQLDRDFRPLPKVWINPFVENIFDYTSNDFELQGYDPHPPIKAPISV